MEKTIDDFWRDWEGDAFGFGYGTGEVYTIPALKAFFSCIKNERNYDHIELEKALSPTVAWLLINTLCRIHVIEYGTSPRYGWLTGRGERLNAYIQSHTVEELVTIAGDYDESYVHCYPDACNCGPEGYKEGVKCPNPFWGRGR